MSLPQGATNARRVGGGDINQAWRVTLANGREAFVKTRPDASPTEYAAEARGLEWLAAPGAVRTPSVLEVADDRLVLAWIAPGRLSAEGAEELGRGLALTHAASAPAFGGAGPAEPPLRPGSGDGASEPAPVGGVSSFGSLRLPNDPAPDWPTFYAQRRLLPLARVAHDRGALSAAGTRTVEAVCDRLPQLAGPPEPPARLHGDLWSGNAMADADGRPWLIDPSAYGGHREIDLAMLRLFGGRTGLESRIFSAYAHTAPLAEGWEERVELWQLLPLLVHAVLFGGHYAGAAERAARRYVG